MYISLNAFEAQVYMDIHQKKDTPDHRWKILCETLAGRGCEDLEIEWEEVKYRGLYKALEPFALGILPDIDAVLHSVQSGKSGTKTVSAQVKLLLKKAEPAAIAFYTAAAGFAKDDFLNSVEYFRESQNCIPAEKMQKHPTMNTTLSIKQKMLIRFSA